MASGVKVRENKSKRKQNMYINIKKEQQTRCKHTWRSLKALRRPVCGRRGPLEMAKLSPHLRHNQTGLDLKGLDQRCGCGGTCL